MIIDKKNTNRDVKHQLHFNNRMNKIISSVEVIYRGRDAGVPSNDKHKEVMQIKFICISRK